MSLINEALKKAQMDGKGKDASAAHSPDVASAVKSGRNPGGVLMVGVVVALLASAGGACWYFMQDGPMPDTVVAPVPNDTAVVAPKTQAKVEAPVTPDVSVAPVVPPAANPAKAETTAVVTPPVAPVVPVVPVVPVAPVVPAAPVSDPEVTAAIGRMKVSLGRKKTGRCVIDSLVFKVGDQLSSSPVITIKAVTDTEVIFSDTNGVEYEEKYKQGTGR